MEVLGLPWELPLEPFLYPRLISTYPYWLKQALLRLRGWKKRPQQVLCPLQVWLWFSHVGFWEAWHLAGSSRETFESYWVSHSPHHRSALTLPLWILSYWSDLWGPKQALTCPSLLLDGSPPEATQALCLLQSRAYPAMSSWPFNLELRDLHDLRYTCSCIFPLLSPFLYFKVPDEDIRRVGMGSNNILIERPHLHAVDLRWVRLTSPGCSNTLLTFIIGFAA